MAKPWRPGDVACRGATIAAVSAGVSRPAGATHLAGLTLPGFANAHSHAFHRVLRSRAERARGTFWTWRDLMYSVADLLTPEQYFVLARAVYAEMALAGFTVVGEFHYLHHVPGGVPYDDPNEMGRAILAAAREAGVKVVLLDTCYLEAEPGHALEGAQLRFGDGERGGVGGDAGRWLTWRTGPWRRRRRRRPRKAAPWSVRPSTRYGPCLPGGARRVAEWAADRSVPLHFHCSEQPAENDAAAGRVRGHPRPVAGRSRCPAPGFGRRPRHPSGRGGRRSAGGVADRRVHVPDDGTRSGRWDRPGPASRSPRFAPLSLGSDSQAVIDPFEEMRALELDERLASLRRGNFTTAQLVEAATTAGYSRPG